MIATTTEPRPFPWSNDQFERMLKLGWFACQKADLIGGEVVVDDGSDALISRRWTRDEYLQMIDLGWFAGHRVELLGGEVFEMPAQFDLHLAAIDLTATALQSCFGAGFWVRRQGSLDLSPHGIPDPDVAVVAGRPHGAARAITTNALLVVEVSDSSLGFDRNIKGSLYAAAGLAEYWIVNLVQRQLERYRDPVADPAAHLGSSYSSRVILDPGDTVAPLAAPRATISVADLFP